MSGATRGWRRSAARLAGPAVETPGAWTGARAVARWCLAAGRRWLVALVTTAMAVTALQCLSLVLRAGRLHRVPDLGDFFAWACFGCAQPEPGARLAERVSFPFAWMLLVMLPVALVPALAARAREQDALAVASGGRGRVLAGQALAVAVGCLALWASVALVCLAATLLVGGDVRLAATDLLGAGLAELPRLTLARPPYEMGDFCLGVVCASSGLALLQLGLAQPLGQRTALVLVTASLGASVFVMTPALPGNLLMAARSSVFVTRGAMGAGGGSYQPGVVASAACELGLALAASGMAVGLAWVMGRDLLGGDGR